MSKHQPHFTFGRQNYMLLLAGMALVIIGFLLMMGGGSEKPNDFNEAELFSFRRITLAPLTVISGYVVVIWAIMKRPKAQE